MKVNEFNYSNPLFYVPICLVVFGLIIIFGTCSSDNNPIIPEPDPPTTNSAALDQLLHMEHADVIVSSNVIGDTLYDISTISLSFRYNGDVSIPVSVVRAITIWYQIGEVKTIIGTSVGFISTDSNVGVPVNRLEPGGRYYFWTNWDNDPFLSLNAFYTNFFVVKDSSVNKNSLIGKSIVESIKEVL